jgi:hypothetical protein
MAGKIYEGLTLLDPPKYDVYLDSITISGTSVYVKDYDFNGLIDAGIIDPRISSIMVGITSTTTTASSGAVTAYMQYNPTGLHPNWKHQLHLDIGQRANQTTHVYRLADDKTMSYTFSSQDLDGSVKVAIYLLGYFQKK